MDDYFDNMYDSIFDDRYDSSYDDPYEDRYEDDLYAYEDRYTNEEDRYNTDEEERTCIRVSEAKIEEMVEADEDEYRAIFQEQEDRAEMLRVEEKPQPKKRYVKIVEDDFDRYLEEKFPD